MIVNCPECDAELELPEGAICAKVQCYACETKFFADETVVPEEFKVAALRIKAERGDAEAQYNLADCYERGVWTEKDVGEAMRWYETAARQNHPRALLRKGRMFLEDESQPINKCRAYSFLVLAAFCGSAEAEFEVAKCHECGIGTDVNKQEAEKGYAKAAEMLRKAVRRENTRKKDVGIYCCLGICLDEGKGVAQDCEEAVKWYRKAAARGHAQAQYRLAKCFLEGRGVWLDEISGMIWLKKAAANGCKEAQSELNRRGAGDNCRRTGQMTIPAPKATVARDEGSFATVRMPRPKTLLRPKLGATQTTATQQPTSSPALASTASPSAKSATVPAPAQNNATSGTKKTAAISNTATGNGREPKIPSLRTAVNNFIENDSKANFAAVLYSFVYSCAKKGKVYLVPAVANAAAAANPVARKYMLYDGMLAVSPSSAGKAKIEMPAADALKLALDGGLPGIYIFTRNGGCPIPCGVVLSLLKEIS